MFWFYGFGVGFIGCDLKPGVNCFGTHCVAIQEEYAGIRALGFDVAPAYGLGFGSCISSVVLRDSS